LAALGTDTVAVLRILRGIGGEEVFLANYRAQSDLVRRAGVRAAAPQAALESGQLLLPAILTSVVTFIGAHEVARGSLQPGQLVAFFGYATFLTTPLREVIQYTIMATRAYVGAGKVVRLLRIEATVRDPAHAHPWPGRVEYVADERSGIHLERGRVCAVVTETPAESALLADRLGRFIADVEGVSVNGLALGDFSVADTRRHIIVNDIEPRLFSGELRYELVPHGTSRDERILAALNAVSALDVLEALDDGLATRVDERGRSFSGGQRQRLALARAFLTDADVLILVEPTSAVDTHTEGRIAARLGEMRREHITLVASTSPLMLERMDVVFLVADGEVVAEGTHEDLVASSALYRQIVLREDS
ncbi:MAG TPA: ABC transporter ATP-binding protein, partial [Acidimicrobiales bacterium]|nr:ABC transporter ATP-binding protein [Acidimicrobiales bacterium]